MSEQTQLATTQTNKPELRARLESNAFRDAVAQALPKHLTSDRFVRTAITAMTRTPKLAQCEQASFFGALMTLSQYGLEPDGRRAHLIPFENHKRGVIECQLIIDYKGLAELAMRSGLVSNIHADVVRTGDVFVYSMGRVRDHVPWFLRTDSQKPKDRGDVIAAYAIAEFKDGTTKSDVMEADDVEAVRRRSRAGNAGPWVTDWNEMAKKTVFRRLSKWLPLSPEFRDAVDVDDEESAIDVKTTTEVASDMAREAFTAPKKEKPAKIEAPDDIPMDHPAPPAAKPNEPPAKVTAPVPADHTVSAQGVHAPDGTVVKPDPRVETAPAAPTPPAPPAAKAKRTLRKAPEPTPEPPAAPAEPELSPNAKVLRDAVLAAGKAFPDVIRVMLEAGVIQEADPSWKDFGDLNADHVDMIVDSLDDFKAMLLA